MICTVTRRAQLPTHVWSGGKTTQLFLHPPGSDYATRNFELRISTATVDDVVSDFTPLPGYHRILMSLDRPVRLVHGEQGEAMAEPFQAVEFEGGWQTRSYGTCTDIGMMLADGLQGEIQAVTPGKYSIQPEFTAIYALEDGVKVTWQADGQTGREALYQGDFLLLQAEETGSLQVQFPTPQSAVLLRAFHP